MQPQIQPTQPFISAFTSSFRANVHLLINLGYQKARSKINSSTEETHITSHICEAIDDIFNDPTSNSWSYFDVDEDSKTKKKDVYGKSKPRIDLIIKYCTGYPRPKFLFEAKRIRTPGYPASIYTGTEGLQCFTSGLYASEYTEAAMLGYVQSHSTEFWKKKLKDSITENYNLLELHRSQYDYDGLNAFPAEWVSEHKRTIVGSPVTIYHILLDCTGQNDINEEA